MSSDQNPDEVLPYVSRVNSQLAGELRKLREGTCQKLYKQTRSFIDAMQRTPVGQNTTYGPSICTISEVRDCLEHSRRLDGERTTHFTTVLDLFIASVETLQSLCTEMYSCIADTVTSLTLCDRQRRTADKIRSELEFCREHLNEDADFSDLTEHKTIEKFRGLNTGEVSLWGAVLNLIPVIVTKFQSVSDATAEWTTITLAEKHNIFCEPSNKNNATNGRSGSRQGSRSSSRGSAKGTMGGQQQQTKGGQTRKASKTYADKVDERNKGKISLLERPPWKPASNPPHNLFPKLRIHLGDPTHHV